MKALCWHGVGDVRIDNVTDPKIQHPRDAIVRITASGICGSDLRLLNGYVPTMESGDILGHESMGEVVAVGNEITNLKVGDPVVVTFTIACGRCFFWFFAKFNGWKHWESSPAFRIRTGFVFGSLQSF